MYYDPMFSGSTFLYLLLVFMNVIGFALMGYDKHCAHYGKRRIPEAVLMVVAVALGAFGELCGMLFFNHKTRKPLFNIGVPVVLFAQVLILAYMFTHFIF